jgi:ribonuclease HII
LPPTGPRIASAPSEKPARREQPKSHRRRLARSRRLFAFDRGLGARHVAGTDEAGRGCLAGPLVAAAVLFDYETLSPADRRGLSGLHDSKQMTEERRLDIFPAVLRAAERVTVVIRSAAGIDRRGLHVTNMEALGVALERLALGTEAMALVDGFSLPRCTVPHRRVIGGDRTSAAIAAASVIAKVTRDRYMHEAALEHPGWGFEEHVGYSTPEHRAAIEEIGISPLHRRSFQSVAYSQLGFGDFEIEELAS